MELEVEVQVRMGCGVRVWGCALRRATITAHPAELRRR